MMRTYSFKGLLLTLCIYRYDTENWKNCIDDTVVPLTSSEAKSISILASIGAIAAIVSISTRAGAIDSQHCDEQGSPSCYSIGYSDGQAHPGITSPSGHSSNFRHGWNAGAAASDNNTELVMHNSPLIW